MSECLYEVLGISKDATREDIKKAYRQRALQLHPDKNPGNEDAKTKFQLLQKVYAILGDEDKRKVYDETGSTCDDDLAGAGFDGLANFFRTTFAIKMEDIDDFTARYQGSADERADLLRYYNQFKGRMDMVFVHLMCSDPEFDSHRLRDVLDAAIESGEAQRFKAYIVWSKSVAARPRPLARRRSAGTAGPSSALIAAIQGKREAVAESFFDALAAKYGGREKSKGRKELKVAKQVPAEPTDSEFEVARKRLEKRGAFRGHRSEAISKQGKPQKGKEEAAVAASGCQAAARRNAEEEAGSSRAAVPDAEAEEDSDEHGAKRRTKKVRRGNVAKESAPPVDGSSAPAIDDSKSIRKQKRKSKVQEKPQNEDEVRELKASGAQELFEAKPAGGREGMDAAPQAVKRRQKVPMKDKVGRADGAKQGAEKENSGGTPVHCDNGKGKDKRLLSGLSMETEGFGRVGHPDKKAKWPVA